MVQLRQAQKWGKKQKTKSRIWRKEKQNHALEYVLYTSGKINETFTEGHI